MGVNSKKPKGSNPAFSLMGLTSRLVEVPMREQDPPRMLAKESGMSNLERLAGILSESFSRTLKKMMTTAVVLMNAEVMPVISMSMLMLNHSGNKKMACIR